MSAPAAPLAIERPPFWNDPFWRGLASQILLFAVVAFVFIEAAINARDNMQARGIPTDLSFWNMPAGFDINQSFVSYSAISPYGRAFVVGLLNTLFVAIVGVIFATIVGFAVGAARLSKSWLLARLATIYVEVIRNVPLLLQLLFWYNAVLKPLPGPRQSIDIFGAAFINNRGLFVPEPVARAGFDYVLIALAIGIIGSATFWYLARRRQMETGAQWPVLRIGFALVIGFPLLVYFVTGRPLDFAAPQLRGFNFIGGIRLSPELVALLLSLILYTASFIAEIVRAGIQSVPRGQSEAALALGLRPGPLRRLVVMPQAMRVIIPPLTNQYLNLTKNSSLAVFIGYPDLVQIFAGTVLNQTGAAVQVIFITMAVYLAISLATSAVMNLYARHTAIRER
ncbi:MAG: ral L-amino acid transport system permease protein [Methylobacteriaceae bacterium]|jgi:general L-amino acid transport system permease protein|nr:ral L-amino acid transport system permease protein [Methylobacteriaceae bacterium]